MANIDMIKGLNYQDGTGKLVIVYGNDIDIYNSGTDKWVGQGQGVLTSSTYDLALGKGYAYFVSPLNTPRTLSSAGTWSLTTNLTNTPSYAKFAKLFEDRMFFCNCTINGVSYQRRAFYTDIIEKDDGVTWGLEYGSDLVQTISSKEVTSASSIFIFSNIKIGDPFIIIDGANAGVYAVVEVVAAGTIVLDKALPASSTGNKFIVGGNWFDLSAEFTGLGEYYNTLLAFEYGRVWRWSKSIGKKELYGVKGTSSANSIVSNHRGYSFWYHPSDGFIQFNGSTAKTISDKIEPVVSAITDSTAVVGWPGTGKYKDHVYWYIGNVTFSVNGESYTLNKAIVDYNIVRNKWKAIEFNAVVTCATTYIESNVESVYLGTSSSLVLKFNTGNHDYDITLNDGSTLPIHTYIVTHPVYPSGVEVMNEFDKHYAWKDKGTGIRSKYKLHGIVDKNDADWSELNELNENYAEVKIDPQKSQARGISFMISEISKDPSFEFLGFSIIYAVIGEAFEDEL